MGGRRHSFKICSWCEISKPLDDFALIGMSLSDNCKDCSEELKRLEDYRKSDKLVSRFSNRLFIDKIRKKNSNINP